MQKFLRAFIMACVLATLGGAMAKASTTDGWFMLMEYGEANRHYTMDADGSNLTHVMTGGSSPKWSEAANKFVRSEHHPGGFWTINLLNADLTEETQIFSRSGMRCEYPTWSPNGVRIAFRCYAQNWWLEHPDTGIWVVNIDGSNPALLFGVDDGLPSPSFSKVKALEWSPDGSKIAFHMTTPCVGCDDIFVIDAADGGNLTNLTQGENASRFENPKWSPDGSRIAFFYRCWSPHYDEFQFCHGVMDADGSNLRPFAAEALNGKAGAWSPDGTRYAYIPVLENIGESIRVTHVDCCPHPYSTPLTNWDHNTFGEHDWRVYIVGWYPASSVPVPASSTHGQIALVLLMAGFATAAIFRRRRRANTPRP